jgi:aldehyde dehydrogenase (NAD+)
MSLADDVKAPIRHADRFFIGGQWVQPSSEATIKVIDSGTEELFFSVAEA